MWISFIHLSLISCVHGFMCRVEVWDPENFILLSKTSHGSSSSLRSSMCHKKKKKKGSIRRNSYLDSEQCWIQKKRGGKCLGLLWSLHTRALVPPAFWLLVECRCVDDEFACHILCMWKLCLHWSEQVACVTLRGFDTLTAMKKKCCLFSTPVNVIINALNGVYVITFVTDSLFQPS